MPWKVQCINYDESIKICENIVCKIYSIVFYQTLIYIPIIFITCLIYNQSRLLTILRNRQRDLDDIITNSISYKVYISKVGGFKLVDSQCGLQASGCGLQKRENRTNVKPVKYCSNRFFIKRNLCIHQGTNIPPPLLSCYVVLEAAKMVTRVQF